MRWALRIAVVASVLTLVIVAFVAWRVLRSEWAPLGPFPEQRVLAEQTVQWKGESYSDSATEIPAVPIGQIVKVEGTKCSNETVEVRGSKSWLTLDPRGVIDQRGRDSAVTRQQGCRTAVFDNPVPDLIRDYATAKLAEGQPYVVVQISGCETPEKPGGAGDGVTLCWRTEPFALVP